MYRTFSLKGTKEGLLLLVKEHIDYDLFYQEIEECFSVNENLSYIISSVEIKGEFLPLLVQSTAEHLIYNCSGGRMTVKREESILERNEFSFSATLRSGAHLEIKHSVLVRGSVNSGAFLFAGEGAVILENLYGTVSVPTGKKIYVGKEIRGQVRIGENIYFPNPLQKNGIWLYEQDGTLCLEDNGGKLWAKYL